MVLVYGHRGAKGEAPENTEVAFRYARALYLDGVQLDVRLSADDRLVVIHDETVDRTTRSRGRVARLSAAKLASLDARAEFPDWPEAVGVPSLEDALSAASGLPRILVSIQPDEPRRLRRVCELLVATILDRMLPSRAVVLSTSAAALEQVGALAPRLTRGLAAGFETFDDLRTAERLGCRLVAVPRATASEWLVQAAHRLGIDVIGWLGNSPEEIGAFLACGVDAIVSDYPSVAKRVIARA